MRGSELSPHQSLGSMTARTFPITLRETNFVQPVTSLARLPGQPSWKHAVGWSPRLIGMRMSERRRSDGGNETLPLSTWFHPNLATRGEEPLTLMLTLWGWAAPKHRQPDIWVRTRSRGFGRPRSIGLKIKLCPLIGWRRRHLGQWSARNAEFNWPGPECVLVC